MPTDRSDRTGALRALVDRWRGGSASLVPAPGTRRMVRSGVSRARLVICTLATGVHRDLLQQSVPTLLASANVHGWDTVVSCEELSEGRPPSWAKVRLIQQLLGEYEYVWWIDADALIVDPTADIVAAVEGDPTRHAWFAHHPQQREADASVPNAGVMLIRNDPRSIALLRAMWECEHLIEHNWWENAALIELLGRSLEPPFPTVRRTEWAEGVGELELRWNSVPGYCEDAHPVVHHHARADHDDFSRRRAAMERDRLATAERYPRAFARRAPRIRRRSAP